MATRRSRYGGDSSESDVEEVKEFKTHVVNQKLSPSVTIIDDDGKSQVSLTMMDTKSILREPRNDILNVFPRQIEFVDVEGDQMYSALLHVQNVTNRRVRMRVIPPATTFFGITFPDADVNASKGSRAKALAKSTKDLFTGEGYNIAAGLSLKIKVLFRGDATQVHHDRVIIFYGDSDDQRWEIPIVSLPPSPDIRVQHFIELGTLVLGDNAVKYVEVYNEGNKEGKFQILIDDPDFRLSISPTEGTLAPRGQEGSRDKIRIEFNSGELGPFRVIGRMIFDSEQPAALMDVSANVVEQKLQFLPMEGTGAVDTMYFGSLFFGQKREFRYRLVNNSPIATNFSITLSDASVAKNIHDDDGEPTPTDDHLSKKIPDIVVYPPEGRVEPWTEKELVFVFQPNPDGAREYQASGFKSQRPPAFVFPYDYLARIETATLQRLDVRLKAQALEPQVILSQDIFQFNDCPVHERRDITFSIQNKAKDLPIKFEFSEVAHIHVKPNRGYLRPMQSTQVLISLVPKQLGVWNETMYLNICDGIERVPMRIYGRTETIADRPDRIRGTKALPVDFKPTVTYVKSPKEKKSFVRTTGWNNPALKEPVLGGEHKLTEDCMERDITFTEKELNLKVKNRKKYDTYLVKERKRRLAYNKTHDKIEYARLQQSNIVPHHGLKEIHPANMSMPFASGLRSPRPKLPPQTEVLWLQYPMAGYDGISKRGLGLKLQRQQAQQIVAQNANGTANRRGSAQLTDLPPPPGTAHKKPRKRFKRKPTTQAERRDCETALSLEDLLNVTRGPRFLDFGHLVINEKGVQVFTVSNDLEQHILVQLELKEVPEVRRSRPSSQMIPPGEIAEFPITFMSPEPRNDYKRAINYIINGQHNFSFVIAAQVDPPAVQLSREEIAFEFKKDNTGFQVCESITITNPSGVPLEYQFASQRDCFTIVPAGGVLPEYKTAKIDIVYEPPHAQAMFEEEIILNVKDGPSRLIRCSAGLPRAECVFKPRRINFGHTCVGKPVIRRFAIKNTGSSRTVFQFDELPYGFKMSPSQGVLETGGSAHLKLSYFPTEQKDVRLHIPCSIRGRHEKAKPFRLTVTTRSIVPEVSVLQDELDFGAVTVGVESKLPLSIENRSPVPVEFCLDLTDYPEFGLSYPEEWEQMEDAPVIRVPVKELRKQMEQSTIAHFMSAASDRRNSLFGDELEDDLDPEMAYKLIIKPESVLQTHLTFRPNELVEYAFELPLTLAGIPAYPGIRRVLAAKSLKPKLTLSRHKIDFGKRVILKGDRAHKNPYIYRFEMKNDEAKDVDWCWKIPDVHADELLTDRSESSDLTWRIEPQAGTLLHGQSCNIQVYFAPTQPVKYEFAMELYLNDEEDCYLQMPIKGMGTFPLLTFDVPEVLLPTVPLNVRGSVVFNLYNEGYDNLDLKWNLPQDTSQAPLSIEFPEGSQIGIGYEFIPIKLSFKAKKPISFSAKIEFLDAENNRFSIPVTGTSDNSIMTNQEFLHNNAHDDAYTITKGENGKPIILIPGTEHKATVLGAANPIYAENQALTDRKDDSKDDLKGGRTTHRVKSARSNRPEIIEYNDEDLTTDRALHHDQEEEIDEEAYRRQEMYLNSVRSLLNYLVATNLIPEANFWSAETFPSEIVRGGGSALFLLIKKLTGRSVVNVAKKPNSYRSNQAGDEPNQSELDAAAASLAGGSLDGLTTGRSGISTTRTGAGDEKKSEINLSPPPTRGETPSPFDNMGRKQILALQFQNYQKLLTFLKTHGGLVNSVKPEYLMSLPQYRRLLNGNLGVLPNVNSDNKTLGEITAANKQLEKAFPRNSRHSWLTIFHQIFKIYILNRVTPSSFRQLPGVKEPAYLDGFNLNSSNLYTSSELVLMRWLEYHNNKTAPIMSRQLTNLGNDLRDGVVLANVLLSHVPSLRSIGQLHNGQLDEEKILENCQKVVNGLNEIGLEYKITREDIATGFDRDLAFFVMFLYQRLPAFVPKTTVEFKGRLHDVIEKTIELTNPTKKPIQYSVSVEGSSDFQLDTFTVRLAPKGKQGSKVPFPVRFKSRFTKSVSARLIFVSDRESTSSASTMVFNLKSLITSYRPSKVHTMDTQCYQPTTEPLTITNIFPVDCRFTIAINLLEQPEPPKLKTLEEKKRSLPARNATTFGMRRTRGRNKNKPKPRKRKNPVVDEVKLPSPVWSRHDVVKIRAGESVQVPFQFLPMRVGTYKVQLIFLDDLAGEFVHEIVGYSANPAPLDTMRFSQPGNQNSSNTQFVIPADNTMLRRVRAFTLERLGQLTNKQKLARRQRPDWPHQVVKNDFLPSNLLYQVTSSSPYFIPPALLAVKGPQREDGKGRLQSSRPPLSSPLPSAGSLHFGEDSQPRFGRAREDNHAGAILDLVFNPKGPGLYKSEITLTSQFDVRVYNVEMSVTPIVESPVLEFSCAARQSLTQSIPIVNPTEDEWHFRAQFRGSKEFTGDTDLIVPAGETGEYNVTYNPVWMTTTDAQLTLHNIKSSDNQVYDLTGRGEEPLAERHLEIECQARTTLEYKLPVKNYEQSEVTYQVESDIPHIGGEPTHKVWSRGQKEYILRLSPQLSGTYSGTITFVSPSKQYVWYSVDVKASRPEPESELKIDATLRKAAQIEIGITNPIDEMLAFEVQLQGDGLFGDPIMQLGPLETGTYQFMFAPLQAGFEEGSISFSNAKAGEFWYKLGLNAKKPDSIRLDAFEAEVGHVATQTITLENPTEEELVMRGKSSNTRNFNCKPSLVQIGPFDTFDVDIQYTPSSIEQIEEGAIKFSHPSVGEWLYICQGMGLPPQCAKPLVLHTPIQSSLSTMVSFRNPFTTKLAIQIQLKDQTNTFRLLTKKKKVNVQSLSPLQIPFIFQPRLIQIHNATIVVTSLEQGLVWEYPLEGVGEGPTEDSLREIKCQARSRVEEEWQLSLPGLMQGPLPEPETFSYYIDADEKWSTFLDQSLQLSLQNPRLTDGTVPLIMDLVFVPLRPVNIKGMLIVNKSSGGRWKFPISLQASEPAVDDIIRIQSQLNKTTSVSFHIANQFDVYSEFEAFFSADSSSEFDVFPKKGILEPAGTEGTQFVVSFSPIVYGKLQKAKLIIQTEGMQWTYELRGTHPHYKPPEGKAAIDNKLSTDVNDALKQAKQPRDRSYVSRNMKAVSSPARRRNRNRRNR